MCFYITKKQYIDLSIHRYYIYVCVYTHLHKCNHTRCCLYSKDKSCIKFFHRLVKSENISPDSHSKYLVRFIKVKYCRSRTSPSKLLNRVFAGIQGSAVKEI